MKEKHMYWWVNEKYGRKLELRTTTGTETDKTIMLDEYGPHYRKRFDKGHLPPTLKPSKAEALSAYAEETRLDAIEASKEEKSMWDRVQTACEWTKEQAKE